MPNWFKPEYLAAIVPPEPMSGLTVFSIIAIYVLGAILFAVLFRAFFEPNYPPSGKRVGYRYTVKSKITGKNYPIWQSCGDGNWAMDYPYLRAIFWPVVLFYYGITIYLQGSLENYVARKRKEFQEKEKLRQQTEKYIREGTLD